ncbi:MAG: transcriptional regulator NrdR [Dehalococcoidales bacterium]|jgi:transcriptional repressor NrdR
MKCPYCGELDSRVIDSREVNQGIRRRRHCPACKARFTTYERLQRPSLFVIKKDHRREEFDRAKLHGGIRKACEKRPLAASLVDGVAEEIEAHIYRMGRLEVPSTMIGDIVMERLKKVDYIAYIRFASVYRDFADISALKQEVDTLVSQLPLLPKEEFEELARGSKKRKQKAVGS